MGEEVTPVERGEFPLPSDPEELRELAKRLRRYLEVSTEITLRIRDAEDWEKNERVYRDLRKYVTRRYLRIREFLADREAADLPPPTDEELESGVPRMADDAVCEELVLTPEEFGPTGQGVSIHAVVPRQAVELAHELEEYGVRSLGVGLRPETCFAIHPTERARRLGDPLLVPLQNLIAVGRASLELSRTSAESYLREAEEKLSSLPPEYAPPGKPVLPEDEKAPLERLAVALETIDTFPKARMWASRAWPLLPSSPPGWRLGDIMEALGLSHADESKESLRKGLRALREAKWAGLKGQRYWKLEPRE